MSTNNEARNFTRGIINLGFCKNCGFISNTVYDSSLLDYSINYEDQQCYSPTFNSFAQSLAEYLVEKYSIYNKDILEIGCGKGLFCLWASIHGADKVIGLEPFEEGCYD